MASEIIIFILCNAVSATIGFFACALMVVARDRDGLGD